MAVSDRSWRQRVATTSCLLSVSAYCLFLYLHPPKAHRSVAFCGWIVHAWYIWWKERKKGATVLIIIRSPAAFSQQPYCRLPTAEESKYFPWMHAEEKYQSKQSKAKQRPALHFDKMGRNWTSVVLRQLASHVGDRTKTMTWLGMWNPRPTMLAVAAAPSSPSSGSKIINLWAERAFKQTLI